MVMMHETPNGPKRCDAKTPESCRAQPIDGKPARHWDDPAAAQESFEQKLEEKHGKFATLEKSKEEAASVYSKYGGPHAGTDPYAGYRMAAAGYGLMPGGHPGLSRSTVAPQGYSTPEEGRKAYEAQSRLDAAKAQEAKAQEAKAPAAPQEAKPEAPKAPLRRSDGAENPLYQAGQNLYTIPMPPPEKKDLSSLGQRLLNFFRG